MKKVLFYTALFFIFMFLLPAIFTKKKEIKKELKEIQAIYYNYSEFKTIRLLHQDTNTVEEVDLDDYIACVVAAEMPVKYEIEALKAQAVVARTYTIYKITTSSKHENADICDKSTCCQAWISKENRLKKWKEEERIQNWNKIVEAVNSTVGEMITYNGKPINAFFHSNSGGKTEIPFYVWGGQGYPYLQVVETAGEENYAQYQSEVTLSKEELIKKIKEKHEEFAIDLEEENCMEIIKRDESNRIVTFKIGNLNLSGVEVRSLLGLKSANFTVNIQDDKITFQVIGYGHGVGMSQTGADALAKQGYNYEKIIKHFYKDVEITKMK